VFLANSWPDSQASEPDARSPSTDPVRCACSPWRRNELMDTTRIPPLAARYALIAHAIASATADLFALETCDRSTLGEPERKARLTDCDALCDEMSGLEAALAPRERRFVVQRA